MAKRLGKRTAELTLDRAHMSKLERMSMELSCQEDPEGLFNALLDSAMALTHADMGNVQLAGKDGKLRIVAHRGFKPPFLEYFKVVTPESDATCGAAEASKKRVVVEDVTRSPLFIGTHSLKVLLDADVRAVQSTPIISSSGEVIGVISTHFKKARVINEADLKPLDILTTQAADILPAFIGFFSRI